MQVLGWHLHASFRMTLACSANSPIQTFSSSAQYFHIGSDCTITVSQPSSILSWNTSKSDIRYKKTKNNIFPSLQAVKTVRRHRPQLVENLVTSPIHFLLTHKKFKSFLFKKLKKILPEKARDWNFSFFLVGAMEDHLSVTLQQNILPTSAPTPTPTNLPNLCPNNLPLSFYPSLSLSLSLSLSFSLTSCQMCSKIIFPTSTTNKPYFPASLFLFTPFSLTSCQMWKLLHF